MEDATKEKVGATLPQEQSCPNKPSSPLAPAKPPPCPGSPSYGKSHGGAGAINIRPRSRMKFADNSPSQVVDDHSRKVKDQNIDPAKKIPTNVTAGAISGAGDNAYAAITDNAQVAAAAAQFNLGPNFDPNMDPKHLRRIMSNRLSAQRSRLRKIEHLANMERQAKELEEQVAILHTKVESSESYKQFLIWEQKTLTQKFTVCEQHKIHQEAQLEKRKAEIKMLRELQKLQEEQFHQAQALIFNWNTGLDPTSSNFNPDAGQYGGEKSNMEVNVGQEQEQMLMTSWETNEPNLNFAQLPGMNPRSWLMSKKMPNTDLPNRFI